MSTHCGDFVAHNMPTQHTKMQELHTKCLSILSGAGTDVVASGCNCSDFVDIALGSSPIIQQLREKVNALESHAGKRFESLEGRIESLESPEGGAMDSSGFSTPSLTSDDRVQRLLERVCVCVLAYVCMCAHN